LCCHEFVHSDTKLLAQSPFSRAFLCDDCSALLGYRRHSQLLQPLRSAINSVIRLSDIAAENLCTEHGKDNMMFSVVGRDEVESQCAEEPRWRRVGCAERVSPAHRRKNLGRPHLRTGGEGTMPLPQKIMYFLVFKMADFSKT